MVRGTLGVDLNSRVEDGSRRSSFSLYGSVRYGGAAGDGPVFHLGTPGNPGLKFGSDGVEIGIGVSGKLSVGSLTVAVPDNKPLSLRYTPAKDSFSVSGQIRVSSTPQSLTADDSATRSPSGSFGLFDIGSLSASAKLLEGDNGVAPVNPPPPAPPPAGESDKSLFNGLEAEFSLTMKGGAVESASLYVTTGKFSLFGFDAQVKSLGFTYTRAASEWLIGGGVEVTVAKTYKLAVELPSGGLSINTATGKVRVNSFRIAVSNDQQLELGVYSLRQLEIAFARLADGQYRISLGGSLGFPAGFEFGAQVEFRWGRDGLYVDSCRASYAATGRSLGKPLGTTGLFISHAALQLQNPFTADMRAVGSITVVMGKEVTVGGQTASLLKAVGTVTIDKSGLVIDGRLLMVNGYLAEGAGRIEVKWSGPDAGVRATAELTFLKGVVRGRLQFQIDGDALRASLTADFAIPDFVPVVGGTRVAGGSVAMLVWFGPPPPGRSSYIAV